MRPHLLAAFLPLVGALAAQRELPPPSALIDDDPLVAEKARRLYLGAPASALDADTLLRLFEHGGENGGWLAGERGRRVAEVLRHHRLGAAVMERAAARDSGDDGIADGDHAWLALAAGRDALLRWLADPSLADDDQAVLAAAFALDDRFEGDPEVVDALVAALDHRSEEVRRGLAEWIVHAWPDLPAPLLRVVADRPDARRAWLRAVAHKPRPDFGAVARRFVERWEGDELGRDERLWAIATLPADAITLDLGREVLRAHAEDLSVDGVDAAWRAGANLPPPMVDALVDEFQRLVVGGAEPTRLLPCFDRMTAAGANHLLSLASSFASSDAEAVLSAVGNSDPAFVLARVRAAIEGSVPLEAWMIRRVGPLLREDVGHGKRGPERSEVVDRMVELVAHRDERAAFAWSALVDARIYRSALQEFAVREGIGGKDYLSNIGRLAEYAGDRLDEEHLLELAENGTVQQAITAYEAFGQRAQPQRIRDLLVERCIDGRIETDGAAAMRALARAGTEADVRRVWTALRDQPLRLATWIEIQAEHPKPWTHPLLLTELMARADRAQRGATADRAAGAVDPAAEVGDAEVTAMLRLALARLGDRHLLEELVAEVLARSHWFADRAAGFVVPRLQPDHLRAIATALFEREDLREGRLAERLTDWLAAHASQSSEFLDRLWREAEDPSVAELALMGLLRGPRRDALVERITDRVRREPLTGEVRELAYSLLGALPLPLSGADQELVAWLALVAPLRDPDRSLERGLRMQTGRAGFPFLSACMHGFAHTREGVRAAAFEKAADAMRVHPNFPFASGVALTNLLYLGAPHEGLLEALRVAVAPLLLELPEATAPGLPLARWWAGDALRDRGDYEAAIAQYEAALGPLVRDPSLWWTVRSVHGERDAGGGTLPLARLATQPWVCRFALAQAAGDAEAARRALEVARRMAAGDDQAMEQVRRCAEEQEK